MKKENQQDVNVVFDEKAASTYDKRTETWAVGRESLHSLIRVILGDLPVHARLLCVGVGTGLEVVALARSFPEWTFTLVEPATAMMEVCRQKMKESGIEERCTFHAGYVDSLSVSDPFDAATCLLVSQFFMVLEERSAFLGQIARRLKPGGYLINSDLASELGSAEYESLLNVWVRMMKSPNMSDEDIEKWRSSYGVGVAVIPPAQIEASIEAGGFDLPVLFFQNLLIHAWYSRRRLTL